MNLEGHETVCPDTGFLGLALSLVNILRWLPNSGLFLQALHAALTI